MKIVSFSRANGMFISNAVYPAFFKSSRKASNYNTIDARQKKQNKQNVTSIAITASKRTIFPAKFFKSSRKASNYNTIDARQKKQTNKT